MHGKLSTCEVIGGPPVDAFYSKPHTAPLWGIMGKSKEITKISERIVKFLNSGSSLVQFQMPESASVQTQGKRRVRCSPDKCPCVKCVNKPQDQSCRRREDAAGAGERIIIHRDTSPEPTWTVRISQRGQKHYSKRNINKTGCNLKM